MEELSTSNLAFVAYCYTTVALSLLLLVLWAYSGAVRAKAKVTPNSEDAANGKAAVSEAESPAVARVLRVHRNAEVNIVPFLFLGLLYVILGATPRMAALLFGGFVAFRVLHAIAYLNGKQPWRSLCFGGALLCTLGVIAQVVRLACCCGACPTH